MKRILYLLSFIFLAACADTPPSLNELMRLHITEMGGQTVNQLSTVEFIGIYSENENDFEIKAIRKRGEFMYNEIRDKTGALVYTQGYDGQFAWEKKASDEMKKLVLGKPKSTIYHNSQLPGGHPFKHIYTLMENGHKIAYLRQEKVEQQNYFVLLITLADGFQSEYFMNADNYRIERYRFDSDAKCSTIEVVFDDFRIINGMLFSFSNIRKELETGKVISTLKWDNIKINKNFSDKIFSASP